MLAAAVHVEQDLTFILCTSSVLWIWSNSFVKVKKNIYIGYNEVF
jgi:hypothetical protein